MEHGCNGSGGGHCGCAPSSATAAQAVDFPETPQVPAFQPVGEAGIEVARINATPLHAPGQRPPERELRQRACTELLRQAAQQEGLLGADDAAGDDGVISEHASRAIEQLLARMLHLPEPGEDACRRHFEAHPARFAQGERVRLRHVLFAVTPGVDVRALTRRAEALLIELRCADDGGTRFAEAARHWSNCPSGAQGGELGWLERGDCAPEFARDVFASQEVGVLPRLVHSRFGLHVVEVCAREAGILPGWQQVRPAVAQALHQQNWMGALHRYLRELAGAACMVGVQIDAADSPLVQ
ncbi:MAG: peptidylprolyl isomerase [Burkholderiaceae bacterium]|nr:peptidylprolyl isomerase [Burkholderiaceae bacterium]